jgi:radical SAM protein with 4Fe4S-binding SPASM domain|tara:strand:- start:5241 stop:6398 length:1158 start_codon:yes stop_codon:yes gene_type:complete
MKKYIKNKSLCPLPFAGLYIEPNGSVRCCSISKERLGNIHKDKITDMIQGDTVRKIRRQMLDEQFPSNCAECYDREKSHTNINFNNISNRLYHFGKLGTAPMKLYEDENNFELQQLDVRWRNTCNGACVYCGPELSSRWAMEMKDEKRMDKRAISDSVEYVYDNLHTLKTIYLCGGEPLMVKENVKLVKVIAETNPTLDIRINTNLSNLQNPVYDVVKDLPNVHWILSAEATDARFEYIRYPLQWSKFLENLQVVQKLPHRISLNMSWNILNASGIFKFIDKMIDLGIHSNSFVCNPVIDPDVYDVRNLPEDMLRGIEREARQRHGRLSEPFMLKYSYEAIIEHCNKPLMGKQKQLKEELATLDARRSIDSVKVFPELYEKVLNI